MEGHISEELLSQEEIQEILNKSKYYKPGAFYLTFSKLSVVGICKNTGLILFHGNSSTGYTHIIERHSQASRGPYWSGVKLENPTKFSLYLAPIDYITVAACIYNSKNKSSEKNKRPDLFDVYIGDFKNDTRFDGKYTLIAYKDTPLIHSFFLSSNKKPFNKKKILDLRQGWVNYSHSVKSCTITFFWSYFSANDVERFKVLIRYDDVKNEEKWYVQINTDEGLPYITTLFAEKKGIRRKMDSHQIVFRMTELDFGEVYGIEKTIDDIIKGKYAF